MPSTSTSKRGVAMSGWSLQAGVVFVASWTLVGFGASRACGQSLEAVFQRGNEAFFRGDYAGATSAYEDLVESGVDDADVHYNLGVAYARRGALGRAIVSFERALRLRPADPGTRSALEAARAVVARRHAEREGEAVVEAGAPFGEALLPWLSEDDLALGVLVVDFALCAAVLALVFVRREGVRLALGVAVPLLLVVLAVGALSLASRRGMFADGPTAIVVADEAAVREGPRSDATVRGRALEGERAEVLARDGEWARIRMSGRRQGWVRAEDVVEL